jgi:hypothetical protein
MVQHRKAGNITCLMLADDRSLVCEVSRMDHRLCCNCYDKVHVHMIQRMADHKAGKRILRGKWTYKSVRMASPCRID